MRHASGRLGRAVTLRRLCVLAVLAPLSVVATVGLMRADDGQVRSVLAFPAAGAADPVVPDLPQLAAPVDAPASVSGEPRRDSTGLGVVTDARFATVDAIPGRALTAYQRAETVIAQADPSCHLSWALVAAIGKVESNHGRYGGALMTADGVVHPAILGPRLTGRGATTRVEDTDAGLIDGDHRFDRAVGPMQFIPSTWTIVGVDADGDGRRDPQDIDDASLATAVYLCSGDGDLATRQGQRSAVHRYNHSSSYVSLVLGIMEGYLHADPGLFRVIGGSGLLDPADYPGGGASGSVPGDGVPTFDVVHPSQPPTATAGPTDDPTSQPTVRPTATPTDRPTPTGTPTTQATPAGPTDPPSTSSPQTPTTEPTSTPTPSEDASPGDSPSSPTGTSTSTPSPSDGPSNGPSNGPTDGPTDPGSPSDPGDPVVPQVLLDAWTACLDAGVDPADLDAMTTCLVQATDLPADDPDLLALLANPPVTPPPVTQTQQQPRAGRRRR